MMTVAQDDEVRVERLELGYYGTNAYIVVCRQTSQSVLIDAPGRAAPILKKLRGTKTRYLLLTHSLVDHIGAIMELQARLKVPVGVHALDTANLPAGPRLLLDDGEELSFGHIKLQVLHTPGHTPGGLCFKVGHFLFSGDTIFPGGPGATGSPDDFQQIVSSIREKILPLPDQMQVFPGHGEATILEKEKKEFAAFASRPHAPDLCGQVLWLTS